MVRWGILGAGYIAHRFSESLAAHPSGTLVAVSCRTQTKADAFAAAHGAKRAYANHEALLADPDIDAIYLALPHGLHMEWADRSLEAGKAVLCEKPCALTAQEVATIATAANKSGCLFMEAMKTRFVPLADEVQKLLSEGSIGEIMRVETTLCNDMDPARIQSNYLSDPTQGGVLLDCGIYCASWLEELLAGEVEVLSVSSILRGGVDYYVDAHLAIGGVPARLECAMDRGKPRAATIFGTKGQIVVEELHRPQAMTVYLDGEAPRRIEAPYVVDDFFGQIDHFTHCLDLGLAESPLMPLRASLRCAEILDAIRAKM